MNAEAVLGLEELVEEPAGGFVDCRGGGAGTVVSSSSENPEARHAETHMTGRWGWEHREGRAG